MHFRKLKGNLIRIKTGLDTYVSKPVPPRHSTPLMIILNNNTHGYVRPYLPPCLPDPELASEKMGPASAFTGAVVPFKPHMCFVALAL